MNAGRVVPAGAARLRGRAVVLETGQAIAWHSTGSREEILIAVQGAIRIEYRDGSSRPHATTLTQGQCAFLPRAMRHRVVNRSGRVARYLYLTA